MEIDRILDTTLDSLELGLVPTFAKFKLQSLVEIVVRPLLLPNGAVALLCNGLQDGPITITITISIILEIFKKETYLYEQNNSLCRNVQNVVSKFTTS